jgi:hypothetical protein
MARRAVLVAMVTAGVLSMPAASLAGGWATVGLTSLPEGVGPGEEWVAEATILQHGRTPLVGVHPRVLVESADGDRRSFTAAPTGRAGVYRARVVFPAAGVWSVSVDDDFSAQHSFGRFEIGADEGGAQAAGVTLGRDGGMSVWTALAVALCVGVLASLVAAALGRRGGGRTPAPSGE